MDSEKDASTGKFLSWPAELLVFSFNYEGTLHFLPPALTLFIYEMPYSAEVVS